MKIDAIVYTSNTGFTARYAALLGDRTGRPVYSLKDALRELNPGGRIVYLGWLCAGSVKGMKKARKHFSIAAVCAVGMAMKDSDYLEKISQQAGVKTVPLFYLRGGYRPEKLTGIYKPMMAAMTKAVTRNPPRSAEEKEMQEAFRRGGDWVSGDYLAPVLEWMTGTV